MKTSIKAAIVATASVVALGAVGFGVAASADTKNAKREDHDSEVVAVVDDGPDTDPTPEPAIAGVDTDTNPTVVTTVSQVTKPSVVSKVSKPSKVTAPSAPSAPSTNTN